MKRTLLFALMALIFTPSVFGQAGYRPDERRLLQQIEESNRNIQDARRAERFQTWFDRGNLMYNVGTASSMKLYRGMTMLQLTNELGRNYTSSTTVLNEQEFKVIGFPHVDVYLLDDIVQFWDEKLDIYDGAIERAYEAFLKAVQLDPRQDKQVVLKLVNISDYHKQRAFNQQQVGNSANAAHHFARAYEIRLNPLINVVDTTSMFYAGYISLTLNDFESAVRHLSKVRKAGYWQGGHVGYYLMLAHINMGEDEKAKEVIIEAVRLFPENSTLIEGLITVYNMTHGDFSEIRDIIDEGLEKDPGNIALLEGLAKIYAAEENRDKVIETYRRIVEVVPDNPAANFRLAEALLTKANAHVAELAETYSKLTPDQRKEAQALEQRYFKDVIAAMLRVHELEPDNIYAAYILATVYYRFANDDPAMEAKSEEFRVLYEQLKGQNNSEEESEE